MLYPSYREIAGLPLAERVAAMRKPEVRARIVADEPSEAAMNPLFYLAQAWDWIFPLATTPTTSPTRRPASRPGRGLVV